MATIKPVKNPSPGEQAITRKGGSQAGGGWAIAPQTKQTTTGTKFGRITAPICTEKG